MPELTFQRQLKESLAQRNEISAPQTGRLIAYLMLGVGAFIVLAMTRGLDYHFVRDSGAITVLSAIFMSMAGGFSGFAFYLRRNKKSLLKFFWLLAFFVFVFFALDEVLGIHEKVGMWLTRSVIGPTETFRNWNDVIVIGYGLAALCVGACFIPEIVRYPKFLKMLTIAFVFFVIHTWIDSVSEPKTALSVICEESAKLYCSLFLAISMFVGLHGVIERRRLK